MLQQFYDNNFLYNQHFAILTIQNIRLDKVVQKLREIFKIKTSKSKHIYQER